MNKFLVTGASGFIGRALVQLLQSESYEVVALTSANGDIANPDTLKKFEDSKPDRVFHLAGLTFVPDSWQNPLSFLHVNVQGTANVAEFCRCLDVPMTFTSAYVYGQPSALPIDEDCPVAPNNPYAFSKHLAEEICEYYAQNFGAVITVVRPFNVYGVGQSSKFLIPTILEQAIHGTDIRVNDLSPKRDYIYVDDLVEAIMLTARCEHPYRIYNIGSGVSHSVKEVIDLIQTQAKTDKQVFSSEVSRPNEIANVVADSSRATKELGWFPKVGIDQGIRRLLQSEVVQQRKNRD